MATTDAVSGSLTKTTLNAASESFGNWVLYNKTFTATTTGLTTLSFFCVGDAFGTMIDAITIDQIAATDNDTLDGGIGNDRLYGGKGNDTLTGGTGSDVFIFSMRTGYNQGTDTISDFDHNTDVIRLVDMLDLVAPQTSSGSATTGSTLTLADLTNLGLGDQRITNYTEAGANAMLTFANGTGVTVQGLGGQGFLGASVSLSLNNLLTTGMLQLTSDGLPTS